MIGGLIFLVGFVGLVLFSVFRMWEIRKNKRFFGAFWRKADNVTQGVYHTLVMGEIPHVYRVRLVKWFQAVTHKGIVFTARTLRAIERPLSRMGHRVREADITSVSRDPSPYLKTITPEKKEVKKDGEKSHDPV